MFDPEKSIRLKKSGRQVYLVGRDRAAGTITLGPDTRWGSGGIRYNLDGMPIDVSPWGEVENFDPLQGLMKIVEGDMLPDMEARQRRAREKMREAKAARQSELDREKQRAHEASLEADRLFLEQAMGANPIWGAF